MTSTIVQTPPLKACETAAATPPSRRDKEMPLAGALSSPPAASAASSREAKRSAPVALGADPGPMVTGAGADPPGTTAHLAKAERSVPGCTHQRLLSGSYRAPKAF